MRRQSPKLKIPTYGPDGERRRDYSLQSCEYLEEKGQMVLERNRRGLVVCATFRPERLDSASRTQPLKGSIPTGTYYSRRDTIAGHKVWELRETLKPRELSQIMHSETDDREELDSFERGIYSAVALSIIPKEDLPEADRGLVTAIDVSRGPGKPPIQPPRKRPKRARVLSFPRQTEERPEAAPTLPILPKAA